ncbi:hypothetical protein [Burkholderia stagnalis]|uniref:Uncharacterized protein n=1 Tax=Burkholderia stagnalis TaxID=1503054 RepID=A0ABX9YD28_9BURK|nr:hypothetical protein [Burkholderia stagnalis]RQQ48680.1 hypothetical protein DF158_32735 [Burkholderia stagnalis]RQQ60097.1 hypothetical protein DF137_32590 [Burkholderia stagnalis]RQQ60388.1 hypothetical protein DF139_32705 [Burkholderia stagnalis]RQQ75433.1 hypothetical protein DF138_32095 [Burkholderia stagnalis]RQQ80543.1 hypothetical protein DF134_33080 [Burkholderia stagnalis]
MRNGRDTAKALPVRRRNLLSIGWTIVGVLAIGVAVCVLVKVGLTGALGCLVFGAGAIWAGHRSRRWE